MDKINFQDGVKVSSAKVTIDEVDYPVTPARYNGATPLSAYVMNKLQTNIENAINQNANNIGGEDYNNTETYEVGDIVKYEEQLYICIENVDTPEEFDDTKWSQTDVLSSAGGNEIVNSPSDSTTETYSCNYINDVSVVVSPTEPVGVNRKKVWLQNVANQEKIYVKNDNGVYEEFMKKEDTTYLLDTYKASGITLYGGSNAVVHNNLVILKMNFGGTFAANTNVTIATLPEKLRPNSVAAGSCTFHKNRKDMEAGVVVIFTDGHIEVSSPTTQTQCMLTLTYSLN